MADTEVLRRTPLHDLHQELGGRMVPFAGYSMPVQYEGILAEHRWTRERAGLFDVSHMGQRVLRGSSQEAVVAALEALTPGDFGTLHPGQMRYTLLLTPDGGILDDLMVTRPDGSDGEGSLLLVFNAGRKEVDDRYLRAEMPDGLDLRSGDDLALLALQGPAAAAVLARHCSRADALLFMQAATADFDGIACHVSRSGYTGEDGFEISVAAEHAEQVARVLLAEEEVRPVGLGARDSLRLEAGLPLYGHDLDETTSPVEAGLTFAVAGRRRREGGFAGADRILRELRDGPSRKRAGIRPGGRAPVREGTEVKNPEGEAIGTITSGGFGPTVNGPIAMGYVSTDWSSPGTRVALATRRGDEPAEIAALPFVPTRYVRSRS